MPNIATVLKDEISRLARKEIRKQTSVLKKASAQYRKDSAEMKRRVSDLQRKVAGRWHRVVEYLRITASDDINRCPPYISRPSMRST